jgi:hypothetical protein
LFFQFNSNSIISIKYLGYYKAMIKDYYQHKN